MHGFKWVLIEWAVHIQLYSPMLHSLMMCDFASSKKLCCCVLSRQPGEKCFEGIWDDQESLPWWFIQNTRTGKQSFAGCRSDEQRPGHCQLILTVTHPFVDHLSVTHLSVTCLLFMLLTCLSHTCLSHTCMSLTCLLLTCLSLTFLSFNSLSLTCFSHTCLSLICLLLTCMLLVIGGVKSLMIFFNKVCLTCAQTCCRRLPLFGGGISMKFKVNANWQPSFTKRYLSLKLTSCSHRFILCVCVYVQYITWYLITSVMSSMEWIYWNIIRLLILVGRFFALFRRVENC